MAQATRKRGLSQKETEYWDRLNEATLILSTPGIPYKECIGRFLDAYPNCGTKNCGRKERVPQIVEAMGDNPCCVRRARRWLSKAREYIRYGANVDLEEARRGYVAKLEWFLGTMRKKLIEDRTEITVIEVRDAAGKTTGEKRYKTKVLRDSVSPQVGSLILKALKEHALVTGARPKEFKLNLTQNNLTINSAKGLKNASNEDMVQFLLGSMGNDVQVLPESAEGVPAETQGSPAPEPGAGDSPEQAAEEKPGESPDV